MIFYAKKMFCRLNYAIVLDANHIQQFINDRIAKK